jgi:hypothetical protein
MQSIIAPIDINVTSLKTLEERLEAAVKHLQEAAMLTRRHGILVTRNRAGNYTAALSEHVPFGITRELVR